jgi:hypothetical protein
MLPAIDDIESKQTPHRAPRARGGDLPRGGPAGGPATAQTAVSLRPKRQRVCGELLGPAPGLPLASTPPTRRPARVCPLPLPLRVSIKGRARSRVSSSPLPSRRADRRTRGRASWTSQRKSRHSGCSTGAPVLRPHFPLESKRAPTLTRQGSCAAAPCGSEQLFSRQKMRVSTQDREEAAPGGVSAATVAGRPVKRRRLAVTLQPVLALAAR